jgi:hypothetical protein
MALVLALFPGGPGGPGGVEFVLLMVVFVWDMLLEATHGFLLYFIAYLVLSIG